MARYTGPSWKVSRRLHFSTLENGKEFAIGKNGKARRDYAPGQHGQRRGKLTEYGTQIQEKQKVRFIYGINEKQFHNTFLKAGKMAGKTGDNFLVMLETRLDNLVYRIGFASTRRQARQLVNHGHITVDGKKVNIPSYLTKVGEEIKVKESSASKEIFKQIVEENAKRAVPTWLEANKDTKSGKIVAVPEREQIDIPVEEHLIVELYSK